MYNGQDKSDSLIQPHPRYTAIATAEARAATYRRFVMDAIDPDEIATIRLNLERQHALGNARFRTTIEHRLGRHAEPAARMEGLRRPRRQKRKVHSEPCFCFNAIRATYRLIAP